MSERSLDIVQRIFIQISWGFYGVSWLGVFAQIASEISEYSFDVWCFGRLA